MSYTSLWIIDKNWSGVEYRKYPNSWLMPPIVWDVLMRKYINAYERNGVESYIVWAISGNSDKERDERWSLLNSRINNTENQVDRIMWELTGLSVFNSKDKEFVADCIDAFVRENQNIDELLQAEHIRQRFFDIAVDIRNLPQRVKYFVIHPTSVDDAVEWWFRRKRLCSWDKFVCEFTLIEDKKVVGFSTNLEMCKGDN